MKDLSTRIQRVKEYNLNQENTVKFYTEGGELRKKGYVVQLHNGNYQYVYNIAQAKDKALYEDEKAAKLNVETIVCIEYRQYSENVIIRNDDDFKQLQDIATNDPDFVDWKVIQKGNYDVSQLSIEIKWEFEIPKQYSIFGKIHQTEKIVCVHAKFQTVPSFVKLENTFDQYESEMDTMRHMAYLTQVYRLEGKKIHWYRINNQISLFVNGNKAPIPLKRWGMTDQSLKNK